MTINNAYSIEELLRKYERDFNKISWRNQLTSILKEWYLRIRIYVIKNFTKNDIQVDRRIVKLMAIEIFVKGGTSKQFQDKFYAFLEECRANKDEEEFEQLIIIFENVISIK